MHNFRPVEFDLVSEVSFVAGSDCTDHIDDFCLDSIHADVVIDDVEDMCFMLRSR